MRMEVLFIMILRWMRQEEWLFQLPCGGNGIQITAWGSFARDVESLNLRNLVFVSPEKEYNRDSEACIRPGVSQALN